MIAWRNLLLVRLAKRVIRTILSLFCRNRLLEMRPAGFGRTALTELIEKLGQTDIVMVEIGSYAGESAELFLATGKVAKIYCVDPWLMFYDPDDGASYTNMAKAEALFDRRHSADSRVVKVKGTIDTFVEKYVKGCEGSCKFDFVYIDGLHTYDGARHDIAMTLEHIKPQVALGGHDYSLRKDGGGYPGVVQAVNERVGAPDVNFADGSWLKFINNLN